MITAEERQDLPLEFSEREARDGILGFWFFIASDVILFSCLFATYAVYRGQTAGGAGPAALFHPTPVLLETLLLLTSSFTVGLAVRSLRLGDRGRLVGWLWATLLLGAAFVAIEASEFASDAARGLTWHQSGFLSAFFTLLGTHGGHVSFGILWGTVLTLKLLRSPLGPQSARKLYTFSLYWHFLDIVWIFIFSFVYLMGQIP